MSQDPVPDGLPQISSRSSNGIDESMRLHDIRSFVMVVGWVRWQRSLEFQRLTNTPTRMPLRRSESCETALAVRCSVYGRSSIRYPSL